MSEAKALAAFERLDRARAVALLRFMADKVGCEVRDPQSDSAAKRARQRRDRPTTAPVLSESTRAAPLVTSSRKRAVAAKKQEKKPKASKQDRKPKEEAPTHDEIRIVDALNSGRDAHFPDNLHYEAAPVVVAPIRKLLAKGWSVESMLTLIEWWPTREPFKAFRPMRCFTLETLFGETFAKNARLARDWKTESKAAKSPTDQPRPGDVDPDEFQRRLGGA